MISNKHIRKSGMWLSQHGGNHNFPLSILLLAFPLFLLSSCARMGSPDGGWYDERPPQVVSATPADRGTGVDRQKVTITFDEFIRIENATEKVVVSPPQLEMPEVKAHGRNIIVELKDSLKANTTYTIDFSDAISDNNEGNPMGHYTYSFSTGDHIDTLEVSGTVLNASNLEPIKGILVGLYQDGDTVMRRVSRTDSRGQFVIRVSRTVHLRGGKGRERMWQLYTDWNKAGTASMK